MLFQFLYSSIIVLLNLMQVSDAKIQQWLSGKEGNIRSLLSTLQYVSVNGFSPFPFFPLKRTPSCQKISPNVSNAIMFYRNHIKQQDIWFHFFP